LSKTGWVQSKGVRRSERLYLLRFLVDTASTFLAKRFAMEISNRPEMNSNGVAFPRVRGTGALGRVHGKLKQRKNIKL